MIKDMDGEVILRPGWEHITDGVIRELCALTIRQACIDYYNGLKHLEAYDEQDAKLVERYTNMLDARHFFHSKWWKQMCKYPGWRLEEYYNSMFDMDTVAENILRLMRRNPKRRCARGNREM